MREDHQPPIWLEISAALLVPAACFGFSRVFFESSTVLPIIGAALLSSAVAVLARRLQIPLFFATLISMALLAALIVNRYAPGTTRFGILPTGETVDRLRFLTDELIRNFDELQTPVPALQPFVGASMIGAWVMAFLTDWGAMRLRLAFEPVLPSGLLFIFTSIPPISAGNNQVSSTLIFGAAVAAWAVGQRAANLLQRGVWLANDHRRGPASIGTTGAVVAAVSVLAGALVGGWLPGAGADPILTLNDQGDETRVVISPFVDIRSRLVNQTSQELFTVAADQPTYWRIAGLDTYEGDIWKVAGDFSPETGRLPGQRDYEGNVKVVSQDFSISALAAIWLPAAFAPSEIVATTAEVTWNAKNSSLTVANNVQSSDGVQYSLLSNVPSFSVEQLQASSEVIPPEIAESFLALPPDLTPQVLELATALTSQIPNRYDKVRAIQDHFRGYDYNVRLGVREGDPIEQFLAERQGFCQQFAGTFALMARALGIPARVATGFTWGDPIGQDEASGKTIYKITGRHTHAWPEVYFDDLGWVAFEPTPGRGLPGAVSYTGAAARQDSDVQPEDPFGPTTTTTTDPTQSTANTAQPQFEEDFDPGALVEPVQGSEGFSFSDLPLRLLGLLAIIGLYVGGLPLVWQLRRQARRKRADTPAKRVETSWAEAVESLELGFDLHRSPSETRTEYAARLGNDRRVPADEFGSLAEAATVARYNPSGVTDVQAERSDHLSAKIDTAMKNRVPIYTRLRRLLDPRRLIKPSSRVVTQTYAPIAHGSINEVNTTEALNDAEPVGAGREN